MSSYKFLKTQPYCVKNGQTGRALEWLGRGRSGELVFSGDFGGCVCIRIGKITHLE